MEGIKDFRSLGPDAQTQLRLRAVNAVLNGMKEVDAAKVFSVTAESISRWMRRVSEGGWEALMAKPRGTHKTEGILSKDEQSWTAAAIRDYTPQEFDLPYAQWTREAVAKLIEREIGKVMSPRTAGRYLARWNYTPHKPVRRSYEKDPAKKDRFLHRQFPAIARSAREHGAVLVWVDEIGFSSTDTRGRSYAPRGEDAIIGASGKRFGCNAISGVTVEGRALTMVFTGSFTAEVFIAFLEMLIGSFHRIVYLLADAHPVHKSQLVQEWLQDHEDKIKMFDLPGYCPELNPQEVVNNCEKAEVCSKPRPRTISELIDIVCQCVKNLSDDIKRIKACFHEENVVYSLR